jgi:hypothetical protein
VPIVLRRHVIVFITLHHKNLVGYSADKGQTFRYLLIMLLSIASFWKSILKIGYNPALSGLDISRTMLLNALASATISAVLLFSAYYRFIGYQYYYGPLYIVPIGILILFL